MCLSWTSIFDVFLVFSVASIHCDHAGNTDNDGDYNVSFKNDLWYYFINIDAKLSE